MTSTVSASPVAGSTATGTSGDLAPPQSPPSPADPIAQAHLPIEASGAFRGTVRPLVVGEVARHNAATQSELPHASRSAPPSGWGTTHDVTAARDLIAGDLVGAYGLASPGTAADAQVTIVSPSLLAAPRPGDAEAHHRRPANAMSPGGLGVPDQTGHGTRGPQGGMHSSAGGGGAASPLARTVRSELVAQPRLRFTPRPALRLVGMQSRRLERPG